MIGEIWRDEEGVCLDILMDTIQCERRSPLSLREKHLEETRFRFFNPLSKDLTMAKIQEDMPDLVVGVDFGMTYTGSPPRFHKGFPD
jgi:hypothetical protein